MRPHGVLAAVFLFPFPRKRSGDASVVEPRRADGILASSLPFAPRSSANDHHILAWYPAIYLDAMPREMVIDTTRNVFPSATAIRSALSRPAPNTAGRDREKRDDAVESSSISPLVSALQVLPSLASLKLETRASCVTWEILDVLRLSVGRGGGGRYEMLFYVTPKRELLPRCGKFWGIQRTFCHFSSRQKIVRRNFMLRQKYT